MNTKKIAASCAFAFTSYVACHLQVALSASPLVSLSTHKSIQQPPELIAGKDWNEHAEKFFEQMESMEGVRLPGQRRHTNRKDLGPRSINSALLEKIQSLS